MTQMPSMHGPERLLGVLAIAVAVACAIAFAIETRPARYELKGFREASDSSSRTSAASDAEPARSYDELALRPWRSGPKVSWSKDGITLRRAFGEAAPPDTAEHALTPAALADRARFRAYEGAPPMIPHPVVASGSAECLACHGPGIKLGVLQARPLPHPAYASCTQCHVSAAPRFAADSSLADASSFAPEEAARARGDSEVAPVRTDASSFYPVEPRLFGTRAWAGAPPTIPHSTQLRSECISCHGPGGREGMRSSHPERVACLQCHAPSASLERRGAHPDGS